MESSSKRVENGNVKPKVAFFGTAAIAGLLLGAEEKYRVVSGVYNYLTEMDTERLVSISLGLGVVSAMSVAWRRSSGLLKTKFGKEVKTLASFERSMPEAPNRPKADKKPRTSPKEEFPNHHAYSPWWYLRERRPR